MTLQFQMWTINKIKFERHEWIRNRARAGRKWLQIYVIPVNGVARWVLMTYFKYNPPTKFPNPAGFIHHLRTIPNCSRCLSIFFRRPIQVRQWEISAQRNPFDSYLMKNRAPI
jgi:hypothetical protein